MDYFLNLIESYGIYVIFIIIMLEYACFPIPSEIVLPLAGAIGYINNIHPIITILIATICGLIGSTICYYFGYIGKNKLINRFTKKKGKEMDESNSFYNKYANTAICVGRVVPICRTYVSFIAGINKHRFFPYIIFTTIGILIWNTMLILLGYYFYDNIEEVSNIYESYKIIILSIIGFILVISILKKICSKNKSH